MANELTVSVRLRLERFFLDATMNTDARRIGILGASGSGKSTLLKVVAGILKPDEGMISVDGRVLFDSGHRKNLRSQERKVGYLFQNYALFPTMTVFQNVASGIRGMSKEETRLRTEKMLEKFVISELADMVPSQLSGGQQQRVAIARIMACMPEVILLDEPFSALDVYLQDRMQEELVELLRDYPGIVILVSHNRDEIYRFCEETYVLQDGKIAAKGATRELFVNPGSRAAAILTGCKNISKAVRIDKHTFFAEGWGIMMHTKRELPDDFSYVGYRAHGFLPVWGEAGENAIKADVISESKLPFEWNFYIRPQRESYGREDILIWYVQKDRWKEITEKGVPDALRFQEEELMFLKE